MSDRETHAGTLGQLSWALFEWARNPYYILIVIYIFGPYFSTEVIGDPVRGQEIWGYINGFAGALTACLAPFLGAIADKVGRRKPWIGTFVVLMFPAILLLWLAVPGEEGLGIVTVAVALTVAGIGFAFTEVFHNAMLPSVVPYQRLGTVSGWGLALGNGGALIILVAMLCAFALPASGLLDWDWLPDQVLFGLDTTTFEHDRIAAPISAVWLLVFALPLFLFTPDRSGTGLPAGEAVRQGLADVRRTILRVRACRNIALYLLARMLFNDGKVAIMTFAMIYASGVFAWGGAERLLVGVFLTVFAIAGGFIGGWLDDIVGSKKAIVFTIAGNFVALLAAISITPTTIFFIEFEGLGTPVWDFAFFRTLPEIVLPADLDPVRAVHHLGVRQQPDHARAHRPAGGDDEVLRALRPVRASDGVRGAHHGGLLHRVLRQPAHRLRLHPHLARRGGRDDGVREGGAGGAVGGARPNLSRGGSRRPDCRRSVLVRPKKAA